jgi:hypothetical protein
MRLLAFSVFSAAAILASEGVVQGAPVYYEPGAFCQAMRTSDDPSRDRRYGGPTVTDAMVEALSANATGVTRDLVFWRCAHGIVLACAAFGTTSCGKAAWLTIHRVPATLRGICRETPNADCAPATHCIYACRNGRTVVNRNQYPVDERGFDPKEWVPVR